MKVAIIIFIVVVLAVGAYQVFLNGVPAPTSIASSGSSTELSTFTAPPTAVVPGMRFSYPAGLGRAVVLSNSTTLRIGFDDEARSGSLKIIFIVDDSIHQQDFKAWVADTYGYVPGQQNNPNIIDDTSVANFTSISGHEALEVHGYINDPDHSLYVLNIGNGTALIVAIQGSQLPKAVRDQIVHSVQF